MISGVGQTVSGTFKKMLGISSPSKVFEGFGNFIDEGLAQGIDRGMDTVDDAMDSLYDSVLTVPKAKGNVSVYGESENGYNGNVDMMVQAFISALKEIGPLAIVEANVPRDSIVDVTVRANREFQRMTGNGLYA